MPRTNLTITDVSRSTSGVAQPTQDTCDVANGNALAWNDGKIILEVNNSGGVSYTFTVQTPGTVDGLAVTDLVLTVAAGATRLLGPFPPAVYNQADGTVYVDPQNVALKCRAYHLT
jgi:hypothetical protein